MSCGPSEALKGLADSVDALTEKAESLVNESPLGKLGDLEAQAADAANSVMGKLEAMVPSIKLPEIPDHLKTLQDEMKEVAAFVALGALAAPLMKIKIDQMKKKWGSLGSNVNIDNLADKLRTGAMDLDDICKLVPNLDTDGINITVKGTPTSFPDIDPVSLLKGVPLPPMAKPKIVVDIVGGAKKQGADFLDVELPTFDF